MNSREKLKCWKGYKSSTLMNSQTIQDGSKKLKIEILIMDNSVIISANFSAFSGSKRQEW